MNDAAAAAGFSIERLSEDALILHFGDLIDADTNARVQAAARALRTAGLPEVIDIAPAYASLLLCLDRSRLDNVDLQALAARLSDIIHAQDGRAAIATTRVIEIPACYGGEYGPDLEAVAAHLGLSPDEVTRRHAAGEYRVAMLGFAPGFPYMLGLDPALDIPRRADPRTRVPAGSVGIASAQTGIYPRVLPGGWHLIGRTPLPLFDPQRDPPTLLGPGDRVRFRAIDVAEFDHPAAGNA